MERNCGLCGSRDHDRRTCSQCTGADVFERVIPRKARLQHVALPDVVADVFDLTQSPESSPDRFAGTSMVGRPVVKIFKDEQTKKKRPFSGVVCTELSHGGKRHFKVQYDDGDREDVTSDELAQILVEEYD